MSPSEPDAFARAILDAVQDSSSDALVVMDLEGRVVSWNASATRLYGYAAGEMVGQSLLLLWPESQAGSFSSHLKRLRAGQEVEEFETVRVAKGGRLVEVSVTLSPVRDRSGAVIAALSIGRDIRGQRRSEEAISSGQARWRALLDSAVDGIVVIDARGHIEDFNPAAERMFGYSEAEVIGENVGILMPSPYRDEHDGYLARYQREGQPRIIGVGREVLGRRKDGSTFPVHLSVGEMVLGTERRFTGILHDLSARTELEDKLREQAALARLGEMAAVIAHEVRNPLAGIRGAIQVIATRLPEGSTQRAVTGEIVTRIDALEELMTDMLLFARPPKPQIALVAIRRLVSTTADLLTLDPAWRQVSVTVEGDAPAVPADVGLLKIVFENLLVNGAQAMQGQGSITVSIAVVGRECSIAFRDRGPGISPEVREKLFTPFFTTKTRGTGLGLATCRRLIDAHLGTIGITYPPDGGTTVIVNLPLGRGAILEPPVREAVP